MRTEVVVSHMNMSTELIYELVDPINQASADRAQKIKAQQEVSHHSPYPNINYYFHSPAASIGIYSGPAGH